MGVIGFFLNVGSFRISGCKGKDDVTGWTAVTVLLGHFSCLLVWAIGSVFVYGFLCNSWEINCRLRTVLCCASWWGCANGPMWRKWHQEKHLSYMQRKHWSIKKAFTELTDTLVVQMYRLSQCWQCGLEHMCVPSGDLVLNQTQWTLPETNQLVPRATK